MTKLDGIRSLLVVFSLALPLAAPALPLDAPVRVVAVHDGDTVTVLEDKRMLRVRLTEIDAPELGQPYGKRARSALSGLCFGKTAELETRGRDRYGRVLARLKCEGVDANAEQVRRGLAWVFTRYTRADSPLYALQRDAQAARRGLWADSAPIPPWEWRRRRRAAARIAAPPRTVR